MSNQPQILRSNEQLPPFPGGNVIHLLRSNPRQISHSDVVFSSLDGTTTLSYGQAIEQSDQLAHALRYTLGLHPGDRVALLAPNSTFYPVVVQACLVAGVVPVPLGPTATATELVHPFTDADIKYVFGWDHGPSLAVIRDALTKAKHPRAHDPEMVWLLSDNAKSFVSASTGERDLRSIMGTSKLEVHPAPEADTTMATIIYSSGTTGRMKGTLLTHRNISAAITMSNAGSSLDGDEAERGLCFLPMYHGYALLVFVLRAFQLGHYTVVAPGFDLAQVCQAVQKHKITMLVVVPPIMVLLAKHSIVDQFDLRSLKFIASGAAPLSGQLADEVQNRLHGVKVGQGYAMSETSIALSRSPILEGAGEDIPTACSGRLLPGIEARLVDIDTGLDVGHTDGQGPDGTSTLEGELWVRGPNVFRGYLNNPEATHAAFEDGGWFRTGDLCHFNQGYIYLTGRSKDLIKVGGRQVAPAELEAVLLSFDPVADCAVVPLEVPEKATEYPLAFVVPKPAYKNSEGFVEQVRTYVDSRVAPYKRLGGGVRVVDVIPKRYVFLLPHVGLLLKAGRPVLLKVGAAVLTHLESSQPIG